MVAVCVRADERNSRIHQCMHTCTGEIKNTTHFSVLVEIDVGIQRLDVLVFVGISVRFRCQRLELLRTKI